MLKNKLVAELLNTTQSEAFSGNLNSAIVQNANPDILPGDSDDPMDDAIGDEGDILGFGYDFSLQSESINVSEQPYELEDELRLYALEEREKLVDSRPGTDLIGNLIPEVPKPTLQKKFAHEKVKSLQMKSLKTLAPIINAEMKKAGRSIVKDNSMMEKFQDGILNSIAETVLLHKQFITTMHTTVTDLNQYDPDKSKRSASEYSYRLSWGINAEIYSNSVSLGLDAQKSTTLFNQILLGIYGDKTNTGIQAIRNQLGLVSIDDQDLAFIDQLMPRIQKYNPFQNKASNEESLYYSISLAWSEVFNALHSNNQIPIDGNVRNSMRLMFEEKIVDLFGSFSQGCEKETTYNMLLKSCISKVGSFQSNMIRIYLSSLEDAYQNDSKISLSNGTSVGRLVDTTRECIDELVDRLKYATEICTKQLLEAEQGDLVRDRTPCKSNINPTHFFLNIDRSLPNYIASIKKGLSPNDICHRYLMLQKTSLLCCIEAEKKLAELTNDPSKGVNSNDIDMNSVMPELFGMIFDSVKRINGVLEVMEEAQHKRTITSIMGAASRVITHVKYPEASLKASGIEPYLKEQVRLSIERTARTLELEDGPFNKQLQSKLFCTLIEALAVTRPFAWGIHEGYVAVNVAHIILKSANEIHDELPILHDAKNRIFSLSVALDQSLEIFKRIWNATINETLVHSDKRFCIGDIDQQTAESIIKEFSRQMDKDCYMYRHSTSRIYDNLINHESINLNFAKTTDHKPKLSESFFADIDMGVGNFGQK